jgi:outer membrane murein-binding lipoprotein Lpp
MGRTANLMLIVAVIASSIVLPACDSDSPTSSGQQKTPQASKTIDHICTDIAQIPQQVLDAAKTDLHIAYGHTSHGSQLTTGMTGMVTFMNNGGLGLSFPSDYFSWNSGGIGGALDLRDTPFSGANDLGNPDRTSWAAATRTFLDANTDINVVIWSWCGQVSSASAGDIDTYLNLMNSLEADYPGVRFIYMTGHLDGTGLDGNLHQRNEQIREYCRANGKWLYDFADIETYNPDGAYFGDKSPDDACDYDTDGNGSRDGNWAAEWQTAHSENVDWYSCSSAHSRPLNANLKAYAAWWLLARLAGWLEN